MSDGKLQRMDVDYSDAVTKLIDKSENMCRNKKIDAAINEMMALEKSTRLESDAISTARLLEAMIKILGDAKLWQRLNDHLIIMTKKRSQLKQAVTKMVQTAITYIDQTPNQTVKLDLIETLRTVTEGKIYVELERARLTKQLAEIMEKDGKIKEAAKVLQDVQVETFGSMAKKEKVEYILEQMRLSLACKDYIRTQIQSSKISTKFFENEDTDELKLKFYRIMVEIDIENDKYIDISKHYWEIYNTESLKSKEEERTKALKNVIAFLLLAPYDNEKNDLMHRRMTMRGIEDHPLYLDLLKAFTKEELLNWKDLEAKCGDVLRKETNILSKKSNWQDFKSRVIEHNIRVIAGYFTRIKLSRMAEHLNLSVEETEEYLSKSVISKAIIAKIDRLEAVVHFMEKKSPTEILNNWSCNINSLMDLINKTTHLINKERMIQAV